MIRYLTYMFERFNPKKESIHQDFYKTLREAYGTKGEQAVSYYKNVLESDSTLNLKNFNGLYVIERKINNETIYIVEVVRPKNLSGTRLYVEYLKSLKKRGFKQVQGQIAVGNNPFNHPAYKARQQAFGKEPKRKGYLFTSRTDNK